MTAKKKDAWSFHRRAHKRKRCKCISYNQPQNWQTDKPVVLHNKDFFTKSVDIDKCIVKDIKTLWKAGIKTFASCCGHNEYMPCIAVDAVDAIEAHNLLPHCDIFYFWYGQGNILTADEKEKLSKKLAEHSLF